MNKTKKKGFTLAELLIVVAIIAVLVAIAIPVFTSQLEKSKEAVDAANLRAAYAEIMADALTNDGTITKEVTQKQEKADWMTTYEFPKNLEVSTPKDGKTNKWTLTYTQGATADKDKVVAAN